MKNKILIWVFWIVSFGYTLAGNPERSGQAGATQLLINPYARSGGFHGLNVANGTGAEGYYYNPAAFAHVRRTELLFSHTRYLVGTDININAFGFGQKFRKGGVIGLSVVSFDLGKFERTTIDNPDGGLGYFSPTFLNLGLTYANAFAADRIFVGFTVKLVHEAIPDASASGVAFDAGVQYRSENGKWKVGTALRNVGPEMGYKGDGLNTRAALGGSQSTYSNSVSTRAATFQLPATLSLSTSYDFVFAEDHTITPLVTFISNSFSKDQFGLGLEYRFKTYLMLRGAYLYENGITSSENRTTVYTGLAAGISTEIPFKASKSAAEDAPKSSFGVDYSYRATNPFQGVHTFGVRLNF
ncbi:MAG: PorV/PorQ family protein [Bacteroidia bacterium]|nr:PorV/PorQ family protein [Bacteroidia bacterium]